MNTEHKEKHLKPGMTYRFRYRNSCHAACSYKAHGDWQNMREVLGEAWHVAKYFVVSILK